MNFHEIESYEEMPLFDDMDIAADRLEIGGLKFLPGQLSFGEMRFNACQELDLPAEAMDIINSHHMDKLQHIAETALAANSLSHQA